MKAGTFAEVKGFLDGLSRAAGSCPGGVLLVAGADLCHAGPRFGKPEPLGADDVRRIEEEDRGVLEAAATGGAEAFFTKVARIGNRPLPGG